MTDEQFAKLPDDSHVRFGKGDDDPELIEVGFHNRDLEVRSPGGGFLEVSPRSSNVIVVRAHR